LCDELVVVGVVLHFVWGLMAPRERCHRDLRVDLGPRGRVRIVFYLSRLRRRERRDSIP
jgi:hypothetical protein